MHLMLGRRLVLPTPVREVSHLCTVRYILFPHDNLAEGKEELKEVFSGKGAGKLTVGLY